MQSLMARSPVARFWRAYETALKHQPLAVQSATAGVLWGAGDVLAQKLSDRERGMSKPLDFRHSALTSLFGAAVIGPLGSAWYTWLEAACTFGQPCSLPVLAAKVLADATVWNAFNISSFFLWNELLLESGDVSTWCTKMVKEFGTTFLAEAIAWPPIMAVIFARLPVSHHLLAVNLVTVFDVAFLATVSSGTGAQQPGSQGRYATSDGSAPGQGHGSCVFPSGLFWLWRHLAWSLQCGLPSCTAHGAWQIVVPWHLRARQCMLVP
ncbi:hypothetical protein V8C86DRAFT_806002 [Haematococcus lacustris]